MKQATATEDFDVQEYYNVYIYNKTSIKLNILTIKKTHREVGRAKDLSAPVTRVLHALYSRFIYFVTQQLSVAQTSCD
jgi:hypothetical protein